MKFKPCYSKIRKENKDIIFIVHPHEHSSIVFTNVFNNISKTYMGVTADCFIDTMRGFLRTYPNFFEEVSEHDFEKDIKIMGFIEKEPTKTELLVYR